MALKAWLVPMCIAALVAGCGSSSDAGETGSTTVTGAALSDTQREEGIMEYLRMPQFDREVTDLITLVAVETDTAKVVFTAPGDREIPFSQYCDSVLDSGYVEHVEVYTEADYSNSGDPSAACDE
jgi:hypothetical protein